MRAFISACILAAVTAAAGDRQTGNYEYHLGGSDWYDIYFVTNGNPAAAECEPSDTSKQSPINFNCGSEDCTKDEALSVSPMNYGQANIASVLKTDDGKYHPAVNMQIGFPVSPTQDGSWWTGKAIKDEDAMNTEKARLHDINKVWFNTDGNCDDACKIAGVQDCLRPQG